jgi:hypothetical protein
MKSPEYAKKYYEANKERLIAYKKQWHEKNKERLKQEKHEYYLQNKDHHLQKTKEYSIKNKDKISLYNSKYKEIKKDELRAYRKNYKSQNKEKINANNSRRRASKLSRTPIWLCEEHKKQIVEIYKIAKQKTQQDNEIYHVDHIVPLQGETVSGLHVPWNLQVIHGKQNISKSNKIWPDSW